MLNFLLGLDWVGILTSALGLLGILFGGYQKITKDKVKAEADQAKNKADTYKARAELSEKTLKKVVEQKKESVTEEANEKTSNRGYFSDSDS